MEKKPEFGLVLLDQGTRELRPCLTGNKWSYGNMVPAWLERGGPRPGYHRVSTFTTVLNAGSGDRIRPAVGEDFSGHTEESGTTGSLGVWGRGASNSLVPSGGPSLHVAMGCVALALITPWLRRVAFPFFFSYFLERGGLAMGWSLPNAAAHSSTRAPYFGSFAKLPLVPRCHVRVKEEEEIHYVHTANKGL